MRSSRLFTLFLVIVAGLIAGYTVAKSIHVPAPTPVPGATVTWLNIQLAALAWFLAMLATGLWLLRGWIARQWLRFTVRLELALDGLFDFDTLNVGDGTGSVSVCGASSAPKLSAQALALRLPPPPEVLANALQDSIHRELGGARIGKSVRVKSDG